MANVVYEWNPFQERIDCRIATEVLKTSAVSTRREFVPRAAPFYSKNFSIRVAGATSDLKLGEDYAFAHPFDGFITTYKRNAFGSVVLLKDFTNKVINIGYDTIGGPFVLDEVAFAELVINILTQPRIASWEDLDGVTIPSTFPQDPHPHPAAQTYDYLEFITQFKSLLLVVTQAQGATDIRALFEEHIAKDLIQAHAATADDFGLGLTPNMSAATVDDLDANSGNKLVPLSVMKEAFRRMANGTLNIN